jgi:hypothetical protein
MMDVQTAVKEECEHIPDGPRAGAQNELRMVYAAFRQRLLAGGIDDAPDALSRSVDLVRQWRPDARLLYDEAWFRTRQVLEGEG